MQSLSHSIPFHSLDATYKAFKDIKVKNYLQTVVYMHIIKFNCFEADGAQVLIGLNQINSKYGEKKPMINCICSITRVTRLTYKAMKPTPR